MIKNEKQYKCLTKQIKRLESELFFRTQSENNIPEDIQTVGITQLKKLINKINTEIYQYNNDYKIVI